MVQRLVLFLAAFLLVFGSVAAAPPPPTGIMAEFAEGGVKVSWQHSGGEGVSFNVYRGSSAEDAKALASVSETFFVDKTTVGGQKYVYFVTAVDASGESEALGSVSITPLAENEKAFTITVLEPSEATVDVSAAEKVDFVVRLESERFSELQDLKAVLVNDELGLRQDFGFDAGKRLFTASVELPAREGEEAFQTTYRVQVSALLEGKPFSESTEVSLTFFTKTEFQEDVFAKNIVGLAAGFAVLFIVASSIILFWRKWGLQKKAEFDRQWLELNEVLMEREICRQDYYKRNITGEEWGARDRELQSKQGELEKRLGIEHKEDKKAPNPYFGFSPSEIAEVKRLARAVGKPAKDQTPESLKRQLLYGGRKEKIVDRVIELVFKKR